MGFKILVAYHVCLSHIVISCVYYEKRDIHEYKDVLSKVLKKISQHGFTLPLRSTK
jgi:hypothetical protein